jgi:hypothetical protein
VEERVVGDALLPVLLLSESEISGGPVELRKTLDRYINEDDVCTEEFTGIIVVKPTAEDGGGSSLASAPRTEHSFSPSFSAIYHLANDGHESSPLHRLGAKELPSGPYFLSGRNLHQAWRLYPDDLHAFVFGMIPNDVNNPTEYSPVTALTQDGLSPGVPVPSRHYHRTSPGRPLAGLRVGLKDIIDVRGVKTTLSSRAYAELYPARKEHAPFVRRLLDLGAVIVGKTKTSQFSTATGWVDFRRPRNPRGDGYQEPSGSSTGGAAALAGYRWLDHSVAGDCRL